MCGVAGLAGRISPQTIEGALEAMTRAMTHRGPDDDGSYLGVDGHVAHGICATRLAVQDLSEHGHQPMISRQTGNVLAMNGEVYNVRELRATLLGLGHRFLGSSDTEVVLAAFDEWGRDCVQRLRGMFAICAWDASRRQIVLARDRMGIKPLYYFPGDGWVAFASEVRTLLETGLVPRRLSADGVTSYLSLGAVREPATIIEGVRALPPGYWGTLQGGSIRLEQFWSLAGAFSAPAPVATRAEAIAELRPCLEASVAAHLVSDAPLGVFLSGGIDSSAITGLVREVAEHPPATISVVFPEQEFSEAPQIRSVVDRFGTDHTEVLLGHADFLKGLPAALASMDQPTFDGVNTYFVSKAARGAGLTVVLSGLGGDELFAGYDSFVNVPRLLRVRERVPSSLLRIAAPLVSVVYGSGDRSRKLARWLRDDGNLSAYSLQRELFSAEVSKDLFRAGGYLAPVRQGSADPVNDVSYSELDVYMRNVLLRDSDVMSMTHSLELRVPFLDHELVEFVAPLPGCWKTEGRTPKALLVEAVRDLLPPEVYDRPKMGFTLPFDTWMRDGIREDVELVLHHTPTTVLEPVAVADIWASFLAGETHWSRPWALYVLNAWCAHNLGQVS